MERSQYTILVVDDNPANRYAIARSLRASGFRTLEASLGAEGLALAGLSAAVVLDVNLPDMHGFEVCRRLRESPNTTSLPIIHVSASSVSDADQQRARSVGADTYMVDPVDPFVLAFTLDELLQRANASEPGDRTGTGADSVRQQMTNLERNSKEGQ